MLCLLDLLRSGNHWITLTAKTIHYEGFDEYWNSDWTMAYENPERSSVQLSSLLTICQSTNKLTRLILSQNVRLGPYDHLTFLLSPTGETSTNSRSLSRIVQRNVKMICRLCVMGSQLEGINISYLRLLATLHFGLFPFFTVSLRAIIL